MKNYLQSNDDQPDFEERDYSAINGYHSSARIGLYKFIPEATLGQVKQYLEDHDLDVSDCIDFRNDSNRKYHIDYEEMKINSVNRLGFFVGVPASLAAITYGLYQAGHRFAGSLGGALAVVGSVGLDTYLGNYVTGSIYQKISDHQTKEPIDEVLESALGVAARHGQDAIYNFLIEQLGYEQEDPAHSPFKVQQQRLHGEQEAAVFKEKSDRFMKDVRKRAKKFGKEREVTQALGGIIDADKIAAIAQNEVERTGADRASEKERGKAFNPYRKEPKKPSKRSQKKTVSTATAWLPNFSTWMQSQEEHPANRRAKLSKTKIKRVYNTRARNKK